MNTKALASLLLSLFTPLALMAADFSAAFTMPRVPEPKIPRRTVNVTDFGAVPDGKTLNTKAIAQAIATLSKKGGGRVVFPPGIWLTGPIELKSKIELHLAEGALVSFSGDWREFPLHVWRDRGSVHTNLTSPIWGHHLEDIAITGRGVVDGNGGAWRPVKKSKMTDRQWKALLASGGTTQTNGNDMMWWPSRENRELSHPDRDRRPNMLKLVDCRRVLLEDVTFQNSANWNLNPTLCTDVIIRNVNVRNPWFSQNGDGLDLENCRNVIVRGSRFDVGDDGICLKSGKDDVGRRLAVPTENILIEDCVVYHAHGGVTIGSEMSGGVRNVRVNNCIFMGTDLGLRFKSNRGRGGIVEKIYISNVRMTDIATDAIGFNMYYGGQSPTEAEAGPTETKPAALDEGTPQFRDIYIENVTCHGAQQAIALQGLPEMPIRGIHLRNVSITAERGMACADAQDITLQNVELATSTGPVITLLNSRQVLIDHLAYVPGAVAVVQVHGTNNAEVIIKHTDLKAAKRDFLLSDGATLHGLKVE